MPPAPKQILVVEDDRSLRLVLGELLEAEGYSVQVVANGQEAMAHLRAARRGDLPDLIVLDLMLPRMSGWDLRALLQEDPALAAIPVLAVSGIGPELASIAADGHLEKPLDLFSFLAAVRRLCQPGIRGAVH